MIGRRSLAGRFSLGSRIDALASGTTRLLAAALIAAVLLNCANVVDRYLFGHAILGAEEIQIFVMIWMTFLGAAVVSWRNQHLRMDVLVRYLPYALRKWLSLVEKVLLCVFSGLVTLQACRFTLLMWSIDRRSEAAEIPMVIPHLAIAVGFGLITLAALGLRDTTGDAGSEDSA